MSDGVAETGTVRGTIVSRPVETAAFVVILGAVAALFTLTPTGIVAFVLALGLVVLLVRRLSGVVEVDEQRIVATRRNGRSVCIVWSEPHDCRIDGVRGFAGPVPLGTSYKVRLTAPDGRRIDVASVRGKNDAVVAAIRRRSTAARLPAVRGQLAAGESVRFGPLRLSRDYLEAGRMRYPIGDIAELSIVDGELRIRGAGRWLPARVPLARISNYDALVLALEELRGDRPPA